MEVSLTAGSNRGQETDDPTIRQCRSGSMVPVIDRRPPNCEIYADSRIAQGEPCTCMAGYQPILNPCVRRQCAPARAGGAGVSGRGSRRPAAPLLGTERLETWRPRRSFSSRKRLFCWVSRCIGQLRDTGRACPAAILRAVADGVVFMPGRIEIDCDQTSIRKSGPLTAGTRSAARSPR